MTKEEALQQGLTVHKMMWLNKDGYFLEIDKPGVNPIYQLGCNSMKRVAVKFKEGGVPPCPFEVGDDQYYPMYFDRVDGKTKEGVPLDDWRHCVPRSKVNG